MNVPWWLVVPSVTSISVLGWALFWPIEPGPYHSPKQIGKYLIALLVCAIAWFIGALAK